MTNEQLAIIISGIKEQLAEALLEAESSLPQELLQKRKNVPFYSETTIPQLKKAWRIVKMLHEYGCRLNDIVKDSVFIP